MARFFKNISYFIINYRNWYRIYYYFNNASSSSNDNQVDDKTNIENIVKNESTSQEKIEGTVVAKRSTENN